MGGSAVHRLGMAVCTAAIALWLVSAVTARIRTRAAGRRTAALFGPRPGLRGPVLGFAIRGAVTAWAGPAGALLAGWVLVGGVTGVAVGGLAALGVRRWQARARPPVALDLREAERQLPFAADLLAACLAAGAGPVEAAEVVGESLGGPVGDRLARAGAELRLGGEPGAGWGRLAEIPGARALADCLERADRTGRPRRNRSPGSRPGCGRTGPVRRQRGRSGRRFSSPHRSGCVFSPLFSRSGSRRW